jgi:hypothetical protein
MNSTLMNATVPVLMPVTSGDEYLVLKYKNGYSLTGAERDYLHTKGVLSIFESSRPGLNR